MPELQVTWRRIASVWWLFTWRGTIGGALMGAVLGAIIGAAGTLMGYPIESLQMVAKVAGALVGLVWAVYVLRMALRKQYGDFRIALVPVHA